MASKSTPGNDWIKELEESNRVREWEESLETLSEERAHALVSKYMELVESRAFIELLAKAGGKYVFDPRMPVPETDEKDRLFIKLDDDGVITMMLSSHAEATQEWLVTLSQAEWAGRDRQQSWSASELGLRHILMLPVRGEEEVTESSEDDAPNSEEPVNEEVAE